MFAWLMAEWRFLFEIQLVEVHVRKLMIKSAKKWTKCADTHDLLDRIEEKTIIEGMIL